MRAKGIQTSRRCLAAGMVAAVATVAPPSCGAAHAQSATDFYARNGLTLIVASGAGGGFDVYARLLARYYGRYLPGNPNIVVKNMPGATGLVAMNSLYNAAPHDGSTILASFNTVILSALYGDTNAKFDPRDFGWIGSIGKQTVTCVTWRGTPVKTIGDARSREVLVGATGYGSTPVTFPKLLNATLGTRFKIVPGYSTPGLRLAVERGEVEGICGIAWETIMSTTPYWVTDDKLNFLLQLGLTESPHLRGVPLGIDLIHNPEDRQVFELLGITQEFGRPFLAPPGVPAERLEALQTAFKATMADKAYLADTAKADQFVDPLSAKEIEDLIRRAYAAPQDIVARAAIYGAAKEN